MAKKWFTMKHHGWGWVPISLEGWLVVLGFIWYIYFISKDLVKDVPIPTDYWTKLIIGIIVLIFISYKKGPAPRWRWDKI